MWTFCRVLCMLTCFTLFFAVFSGYKVLSRFCLKRYTCVANSLAQQKSFVSRKNKFRNDSFENRLVRSRWFILCNLDILLYIYIYLGKYGVKWNNSCFIKSVWTVLNHISFGTDVQTKFVLNNLYLLFASIKLIKEKSNQSAFIQKRFNSTDF